MQIAPDFTAGIRLAFRARYFSFAVWLTVGLVVTVLTAAQFSGRQPATVGLDVGLSVIRLSLPVLGVLLLQELLSREFDRKLFLTSLTYPRPRHLFLLGRVLATMVLVLALLAALGVVLAGLTEWIARGYEQATPPALGAPYLTTLAFVALDVLVILSIGTLIAVTAVTPSFVLVGTIGFMLVARSFSAIVELLTRNSTLVSDALTYQSSLSLLGYLVPDLATLDVRMISLYGQWTFLPSDWGMRTLAALAYALGVIGLAAWILSRKRFN